VEVHDDLALREVTTHVPFKKGLENDQRLRIYRVATPDGRSLAEQLALAGYGWPDPAASRALEYPVIVAAATEARAYQRGCAWRASMQP
jgi:hypothetical protein